MIDQRLFNRILNRALALPLLVMVLLAACLVWQIGSLVAALNWVDHTDQVISQARRARRIVLDIADDQRGYLLAGDPKYASRVRSESDAFERSYRTLYNLVSDNPRQQSILRDLRSDYDGWLKAIQAESALRGQGRNYVAIFRQGASQSRLDALDGHFNDFVTREERYRVRRSASAHTTQWVAMALAAGLTLLFGAVLAFFTRRQMLGLSSSYRSALSELREERERFASTLHSIGDAVLATDAGGRVTLLNPIAERLTGWNAAEAIGRPHGEVFHIINEQTRQVMESPVERVLRTGEAVELANHALLVGRDGTETAIDDSGAPIRLDNRTLAGSVLVFRDVTERRASTARLRRQAELLELAHDTIMVHDMDSRITFWNRAAEVMYGWSRQEALGCVGSQLLHTQFPESREAVMRSLESTGYWEGELVHTRRDGARLIVASRWALQRDVEGAPIAILEIVRDVTESRHIERALQESEERLRLAVEGAGLGTWHWNLATDELYWSDRCKALFGLPPDAVIDYERFRQMVYAEDRARVEQGIRHAIEKGVDFEAEYHVVWSDGSVHWIYARGRGHRGEQGVTRHFEGIAMDIDTRKRHEAEIASLNERLRRAMSETHHRVKNNLQVIAALVDMQVMEGRPMVPVSELKRLGQHILSLAVIHDLLTQEAKSNGDVEHVRTGEVMEKLTPLVQALAGDRALRFHVEDMRVPIRQGTSLAVLVNELVSNAVKHGQGTIELSLSARDGVAHLEVDDEGPGFPPDFEPARAANTGLDLVESLSRWDLGGEVSFLNRPDGGARVLVTFPIDDAGRSASQPDMSSSGY